MRKSTPKVVVKPHYIGTEQRGKIFKRVFTLEIQRKLKQRELAANNAK